jgi:hypothetical protein
MQVLFLYVAAIMANFPLFAIAIPIVAIEERQPCTPGVYTCGASEIVNLTSCYLRYIYMLTLL